MNSGFLEKENGWYSNIGNKIKALAKWTFIVESIGAIISGIVTLGVMGSEIWIGLLIIVLGPIIALVSSWILYAFGHLVQTTEDNYKLNARTNTSALQKSAAQAMADNERIKKIEALRVAGMITEEEYLDAVAKVSNGGAE